MNHIPIVDKEERLLYNRNKRIEDYRNDMNLAMNGQIPSPDCVRDYSHYERWIQAEEELRVGYVYSVDLASPGCGKIHYEITRIEENGDVYGVCTSDYVQELEESDVI